MRARNLVIRSSRKVDSWPGYGAAVWALSFAGFHVLWAVGYYVGLDPDLARKAFEHTWFFVYDLVVAGLCVLAVPVALALVQPWGGRLPRWFVSGIAWTGTGLLVLRGAAGAIQTAYRLVSGRDVLERGMVWEVWFWVGAILFWWSTQRYWRSSAAARDSV